MAKPSTLQARAAANAPAPRSGGHKYPDEFRTNVLENAKVAILDGKTLRQIADDHGINLWTLHNWLHALGDEYSALRQRWIDSLLLDAGEEIDEAETEFQLARGRERWRKATWYAERRDPARYGAKPQEQAASITVVIDQSCGGTVTLAQNSAKGDDPPVIELAPSPDKSST